MSPTSTTSFWRRKVQSYRHRPAVIEARLAAFERNDSLYQTGNLSDRAVALDAIQQVYQLLQLYRHDTRWGRYRLTLRQQARELEARLRTVDADYFHTLRDRIRSGHFTADTLRALFDRHTQYRPGRLGQLHRGYDALDTLVQGIIRSEQAPIDVQPPDGEMTHYEPTPGRAVLDMIDQSQIKADDVFYDLGAGLGHVAMMVNLLTGATVQAVEIEAVYCQHAQQWTEELGLSNVQILNRDAREVEYADGTIFFMYTPFTGNVMQTVLDKLKRETHHRPITVCTLGASTFEVADQAWLHLQHADSAHAYTIAVFKNR